MSKGWIAQRSRVAATAGKAALQLLAAGVDAAHPSKILSIHPLRIAQVGRVPRNTRSLLFPRKHVSAIGTALIIMRYAALLGSGVWFHEERVRADSCILLLEQRSQCSYLRQMNRPRVHPSCCLRCRRWPEDHPLRANFFIEVDSGVKSPSRC